MAADIADLVAKLDALYKAATTEGTHDNGALLHDTGDETCEPDCRACDFEAALEAAWPKELRRIVVAAKEWEAAYARYMKDWPDGLQPDAAGVLDAAEDALVAAVRGEA